MSLPKLRLKTNADRRLRAGHLWLYSNEVDVQTTPLNQFSPGDQVIVENASGKALGVAGVSPNNLICARLLSRNPEHKLTKSLLVHRLNIALGLRQMAFAEPYYRLVYGDSDFLPGLVVDRFGDYLVAQISSPTMERQREAILEALLQVLKPAGVLWKNDNAARASEGLPNYVEDAYHQVPDWLALVENGVRFEAPVRNGQKTGWFYDHRLNRARMASYVKGKRVLDLFSYIGGWGVQAAAFGAREVLCVDASAMALDGVERNATLNQVAERIICLEGDAFEALKELKAADERFDVGIADPPAFIKKRKDQKNGQQAYRRLNEQAMRLLNRDGVLISASCSMHLAEDDLIALLLASARHLDRDIQLLERGAQGPDHPVHPAISETRYLKSLTCRILATQ